MPRVFQTIFATMLHTQYIKAVHGGAELFDSAFGQDEPSGDLFVDQSLGEQDAERDGAALARSACSIGFFPWFSLSYA